MSLGHHFKQYNGFLLVDRGWGNNLYKAHGRVMVDITTFQVKKFPAKKKRNKFTFKKFLPPKYFQKKKKTDKFTLKNFYPRKKYF